MRSSRRQRSAESINANFKTKFQFTEGGYQILDDIMEIIEGISEVDIYQDISDEVDSIIDLDYSDINDITLILRYLDNYSHSQRLVMEFTNIIPQLREVYLDSDTGQYRNPIVIQPDLHRLLRRYYGRYIRMTNIKSPIARYIIGLELTSPTGMPLNENSSSAQLINGLVGQMGTVSDQPLSDESLVDQVQSYISNLRELTKRQGDVFLVLKFIGELKNYNADNYDDNSEGENGYVSLVNDDDDEGNYVTSDIDQYDASDLIDEGSYMLDDYEDQDYPELGSFMSYIPPSARRRSRSPRYYEAPPAA